MRGTYFDNFVADNANRTICLAASRVANPLYVERFNIPDVLTSTKISSDLPNPTSAIKRKAVLVTDFRGVVGHDVPNAPEKEDGCSENEKDPTLRRKKKGTTRVNWLIQLKLDFPIKHVGSKGIFPSNFCHEKQKSDGKTTRTSRLPNVRYGLAVILLSILFLL